MKHLPRPALAGICAFVLAACLAPPACAQLKKPPPIAGRWQFQTSEIPNKGCAISGEIDFVQNRNAPDYSCSFVSREVCGPPEDGNVAEVKQSCTAKFSGLDLQIISKVDRIVRVPRGAIGYTYRADNFFIRPKSSGEMLGHFQSINEAPVRFWRSGDLVS